MTGTCTFPEIDVTALEHELAAFESRLLADLETRK